MASVASIARSIGFYSRLGFGVIHTFTPEGDKEASWAYLQSNEARLMLTTASAPVVAENQAVLFYVYFDDIIAVHAELESQGFAVGPLSYPSYCPKGEFQLADPDGYCLMLSHT